MLRTRQFRNGVTFAIGLLAIVALLGGCVAPAAPGASQGEAAPQAAEGAPDKVVIWSPGDNGPVADWNTDPILAEVEKATNTDIEMVKIGWDTYIDQVNAAVAAGNLPDIIGAVDHTNKTLLNGFVRDGVIAPFEGEVAAAAPNVLAQYEENAALGEIKMDGKIYFQPISWGMGNDPNMGLIHVRKDLLDKYGMQPPETFEAYFDYLAACKEDGSTGVVFSAMEGVGAAINAFAGAYGLPMRGWVDTGDGFGFYAVQPEMKDALLLFRQMVAADLVDPISWESTGDQARTQYVTGKACSYIFNGGGHIGRIQNDLTLANPEYKEWLLPALDAGQGARGYTTEPMFWGASMLGNMQNNNPAAAARVLNYLTSPEGYKLTAVGVEGIDYQQDGDAIELLPARTSRGFPTEAGDTGAHPLATTIVSWVPMEWQDFSLLYGKDQEYVDWYNAMRANQSQYQIPSYGLDTTSPLWTDFQATSAELIVRAFTEIVRAGSDEEAAARFDQFVQEWNAQGGAEATAEMSGVLQSIYQ
jgi:putative aldouronate transport system substrate-binding protein